MKPRLAVLRRAAAPSKFAFALSLCAYAFACQDWRVLAAIIAILAGLLAASGEWDRGVWLLFGVFAAGLPTLLVLFVLGGVEKSGSWTEGTLLGLGWLGLFALRLFVLVLADVLVVKWTGFSDMLLSLRALGLPAKAVLFVSAMVGLLPRAFALARQVVEVQRCRGLAPKQLARPRHLLALFVPVFLIQMRRATDLALSLELRGIAAAAATAGLRPPFGPGDALFLAAALAIWTEPVLNLVRAWTI